MRRDRRHGPDHPGRRRRPDSRATGRDGLGPPCPRPVRGDGARRIRADRSSRYLRDLRRLLLKAAGPVPVVASALRSVAGVQAAYVFGSWARRLRGEPDADAPRDVDLLVIGGPDPAAVHRATADAAETLGQDVDPVILTAEEWDDASRGRASVFLRAVREGPLTAVIGPPA